MWQKNEDWARDWLHRVQSGRYFSKINENLKESYTKVEPVEIKWREFSIVVARDIGWLDGWKDGWMESPACVP